MLLFFVYALPFIHIFPYIWFHFDTESPLLLWGFPVNPYMTDKEIIELMSMIAAVGAAGFMAGTSLLRKKLSKAPLRVLRGLYRAPGKTISIQVFLAFIATAIAFTWISAPAETVFTAAYTQSESLHSAWDFSSAGMFSYSFLVFALADSIFEPSQRIGKVKRKIVLYSILLIVIWFQLLRGDRESLPLVVAALLMYYVWGKALTDSTRRRVNLNWTVLGLLVFVVFVASYFVGALRFSLIEVDSVSSLLNMIDELEEVGVIGFDNLITGTWSGVLFTPLSVAGDYINGSLLLKYGQTYVNLFASLVPGFLANWIGYARPIDSFRGPAWEMIYGGGGVHAVVVPFMDFRMAGVFIVVGLWSFALAKIERYSIKRLNVPKLALLGIVAMAVPHWLWYGEKNIMNALIIWLMLSILYRVRLHTRPANSMGGFYQPSKPSF